MLGWVYRAALGCRQLDQVLIATDSEEVTAYAGSQGWPSILTPSTLISGTDRVHAVAELIDADIYVNIQGDEPLLRPEHIDLLLRPFARIPTAEVTTLSTPCPPEQIQNPNAVKVVTATDGRALYFSRSTIPHHRDGGTGCTSTLASTLIARPHCSDSPGCRQVHSNPPRGWSSCDYSKMASPST